LLAALSLARLMRKFAVSSTEALRCFRFGESCGITITGSICTEPSRICIGTSIV
jgi:hypothetical protein